VHCTTAGSRALCSATLGQTLCSAPMPGVKTCALSHCWSRKSVEYPTAGNRTLRSAPQLGVKMCRVPYTARRQTLCSVPRQGFKHCASPHCWEPTSVQCLSAEVRILARYPLMGVKSVKCWESKSVECPIAESQALCSAPLQVSNIVQCHSAEDQTKRL
jgi:hypothetical protein